MTDWHHGLLFATLASADVWLLVLICRRWIPVASSHVRWACALLLFWTAVVIAAQGLSLVDRLSGWYLWVAVTGLLLGVAFVSRWTADEGGNRGFAFPRINPGSSDGVNGVG